MIARPNARTDLSGLQKHELGQAVVALARLESTVKAIKVWADLLARTDVNSSEEIESAAVASKDIAILADVALNLQIDVAEALSLAFDGLSWRYEAPGFPEK